MNLKNSNATIKIPKLLKSKLTNKKIYQIYRKFEKTLQLKENFVVAVSGGPDSLALAFLAKIYSIKWKLNARFLIIDHKLRTESTKEANFVKKVLKKNFIDAEVLTWRGKKPSKNIQSLARSKRYEILFKYCDKFRIKNILLGHHQDDLFENFFIRMLRGSGLKGLISFDKKIEINQKYLLRPLINQNKKDLILISKKIFNVHIQDPTNEDRKYLRTKVRKLIKELQKEGLDNFKFLKTIKNLKYSNEVVKFYVDENLKKNTFFSKENKRLVMNKNFFNQPYEVIFRGMSDSLKLIGQKYYLVRGKKLDKIIQDIKNNLSFKGTLGGCIVEKVNHTVIISKER